MLKWRGKSREGEELYHPSTKSSGSDCVAATLGDHRLITELSKMENLLGERSIQTKPRYSVALTINDDGLQLVTKKASIRNKFDNHKSK